MRHLTDGSMTDGSMTDGSMTNGSTVFDTASHGFALSTTAFKGMLGGRGLGLAGTTALYLAAFCLAGCAAGHIEPLSQPVKAVTVGLSSAQIELRATAESANRTPWAAVEDRSASFSAATVFAVLVDGLGVLSDEDAGQAGDEAGEQSESSTKTKLSADAKAYLDALSVRSGASLQMTALEGDVATRIRITRSFIGAASTVLAAHRLEADVTAAKADHAAEDRDLINDTIGTLRRQHAVFSEVAGVVTATGGSAALVFQALGVWHQDLAALERLQDSLGDGAV